MDGTTLADFANALMRLDHVRRALVLTEGRTGNPALLALDLTQVAHLNAVAYAADGHGLRLPDVWRLTTPPSSADRYDLIMLDPFHTYESSYECIEGCLDLLQPGGVMLVHDCLPPPTWTRPTVVLSDEGWCGVTFAALRDVCCARGVEWFTIDVDFGIGVALSRVGADDGQDFAPWTLATHGDFVERYAADPYSFMRTVSGDDGWAAIERAMRGETIEPLLATFHEWEPSQAPSDNRSRPRPGGLPERELMARMITGIKDELNRERAHQPTWRELGYHALHRLGLR